MTDLPRSLQAAIQQAMSDHPDWTAEQFMAEIGAAVTNQATRDAIESHWLWASIHLARNEQGRDISVDEMDDRLKAIVDDARTKMAAADLA